MRQPSDHVVIGPGGSDGGGEPHATPRGLLVVRAVLVGLFIARGIASLLDASSAMDLGVRPGLAIGPAAVTAVSPVWPTVWGILSLTAACALWLRLRFGWLLAIGVAVAYVVSGISDLSVVALPVAANTSVSSTDLSQTTLAVAVVQVGVPVGVLAALGAVRHQFLPRRPRPAHAGRPGGPKSTLERWKGRR